MMPFIKIEYPQTQFNGDFRHQTLWHRGIKVITKRWIILTIPMVANENVVKMGEMRNSKHWYRKREGVSH